MAQSIQDADDELTSLANGDNGGTPTAPSGDELDQLLEEFRRTGE